MTNPQDQFSELTRRTQEGFRTLWQQWSEKAEELMKGVTGRARSAVPTAGNSEEVLDAVFDFAENLIAQQRSFAKQMLAAAARAQESTASAASGAVPTTSAETSLTAAAPSGPATTGAPPPGESTGRPS